MCLGVQNVVHGDVYYPHLSELYTHEKQLFRMLLQHGWCMLDECTLQTRSLSAHLAVGCIDQCCRYKNCVNNASSSQLQRKQHTMQKPKNAWDAKIFFHFISTLYGATTLRGAIITAMVRPTIFGPISTVAASPKSFTKRCGWGGVERMCLQVLLEHP